MNLWPLLTHLEKSGVLLTTEGEASRLRVKSEKPLSDLMKRTLATHKDELLDLIITLEEAAAILEINQGLSCVAARYEAGRNVRGSIWPDEALPDELVIPAPTPNDERTLKLWIDAQRVRLAA